MYQNKAILMGFIGADAEVRNGKNDFQIDLAGHCGRLYRLLSVNMNQSEPKQNEQTKAVLQFFLALRCAALSSV